MGKCPLVVSGVACADGGGGSVAVAVMEVAADNVSHCPLAPPAPTVVLERECSGTPPPCASSTHCGARGGAGQSGAHSLENA